jgi:hypothetical protein
MIPVLIGTRPVKTNILLPVIVSNQDHIIIHVFVSNVFQPVDVFNLQVNTTVHPDHGLSASQVIVNTHC